MQKGSAGVHILSALKDNYIYVLQSDKECAVIDPGEARPVLEFLSTNSLRLTRVLCTHHHHDHVGGIPELVQKTGCMVAASQFNQTRIPHCRIVLSEDRPFYFNDIEIRMIDVPGHTHGALAFVLPLQLALFSGDTLFSAGCGRLFEGTSDEMFSSLKKIKELPPETKIYFGHEYTLRNLDFILAQKTPSETAERVRWYRQICLSKLRSGQTTTPTTLAQELEINPFLMASDVNEFYQWRSARDAW